MKTTTHERFRLKPGMRVQLLDGPAVVKSVSACAAVCEVTTAFTRDFKSPFGVPVHIAGTRKQTVRISPNSEVQILL
jgi:hypothetical protein